jgi:predicted enzyme related to lactoylglutathione lyase
MSLYLQHITIDCDDPMAVATFWSAVFERPIDDGASPFFASIGMPHRETQPALLFIKVPEPKTAKNRMHVDLRSDDRTTEVARLISLGASHIHDKTEWGQSWSVMHDPERNEFCVA